MQLWVGVIAAVAALLGAGVAGVVQYALERMRGARGRIEAEAQRDHDRQERRYEDRLEAYTALFAAVRELRELKHRNPTAYKSPDYVDFLDRWRPAEAAAAKVELLMNAGSRHLVRPFLNLAVASSTSLLTADSREMDVELDQLTEQLYAAARADLGVEMLPGGPGRRGEVRPAEPPSSEAGT